MPGPLDSLQDRKDYADGLLSVFEQRMDELAAQYFADEIGIGDWQITMRQEMRTMNSMMLVTAAGGDKSEVDPDSWLKLGSELRSQDGYLEDFAHAIVDDDMSEEAIAARSKLYARSTQATFWRQTAEGMGIDLPAM